MCLFIKLYLHLHMSESESVLVSMIANVFLAVVDIPLKYYLQWTEILQSLYLGFFAAIVISASSTFLLYLLMIVAIVVLGSLFLWLFVPSVSTKSDLNLLTELPESLQSPLPTQSTCSRSCSFCWCWPPPENLATSEWLAIIFMTLYAAAFLANYLCQQQQQQQQQPHSLIFLLLFMHNAKKINNK